jgi:tetratricopeptide (TPR) repeat protein
MSDARPETPRLRQELVGHIEGERALFVAGTGVSVHATRHASTASWVGLIKDGLAYCAELKPKAAEWPNQYGQLLATGARDASELIAIASIVEKALTENNRRGGDWTGWLRKTIGQLKKSDDTLVTALHTLGRGRLATCNYDDILTSDDYSPVPYTNLDGVIRVLNREDRGVIHLHGHWKTPESVVLGYTSYSALLSNDAAQSLQQSLCSLSSLVFVGFGAGLEDPNFGALLEWMGKTFAERGAHHFWLVKNGDIERAHAMLPKGCRVAVLGYGNDHASLGNFLSNLAADAGLAGSRGEPFVGRRRELAEFNRRLTAWLAAPPQPWCIAIDGLGGAGKTTLANELLDHAGGCGVFRARLMKPEVIRVSMSREVLTLQRELAKAIQSAMDAPFKNFARVLEKNPTNVERSAAWHHDLRSALEVKNGSRLIILLDEYERLSRLRRAGGALPSHTETADENGTFCHPWVYDAITRSSPHGVLWILAGRGTAHLDLPEGAQFFRLEGLEREAVFKLVRKAGSADPLQTLDKLMAATGGHALGVRIALRGKGFEDEEDSTRQLSNMDAEIVVRALRYLWVEHEAANGAALERDAVVGLALAGALPKSIADMALDAAALMPGHGAATRLWRTFPELFEECGKLNNRVASALMRTVEKHTWPTIDPILVAKRLHAALTTMDRSGFADEDLFAMDAAMVSLAAWLPHPEGHEALTRFLLRSHVSSPGVRIAIAELATRESVRKLMWWKEVSELGSADRILGALRRRTKDSKLKGQLEMAFDALRFDQPDMDLDAEMLPTDKAEQALLDSEPLAREVAAYWLDQLATLAFSHGAHTRARHLWTLLETSAPTPSGKVRAQSKLANCLAYEGRLSDAKKALGNEAPAGLWEKITKTADRAKDRKLRRSLSLLQSRDVAGAHELATQLASEFPNDLKVLERLVHTSRRSGVDGPDVPKGPLQVKDVRFMIYVGELQLRDGNLDTAESFFSVSQDRARTLLKRDAAPANRTLLASATSRLAEVALMRGRLDEACKYFDERIAVGEEGAAKVNRGRALHASSQTKHARTRGGFVRLLLNDRGHALDSFEKAIALDPTYFHAHLGKALCGVDVLSSLAEARRGALVCLAGGHDPIAGLDLQLLAALSDSKLEQLPPKPRDASKLAFFIVRVEAAARSSLATGTVRELRTTVCDWLGFCPPWLGSA